MTRTFTLPCRNRKIQLYYKKQVGTDQSVDNYRYERKYVVKQEVCYS